MEGADAGSASSRAGGAGSGTSQLASRRSCGRSGDVAVIVDTGPLYAAADSDDEHHDRCLAALDAAAGPLIVPDLVVTEAAYFIGSRLGAQAEVRFIGSLAAGELIVERVAAGDWLRIAELVGKYHDLPLGTVDGAVVAIAERLGLSTLISLDAHFRAVRPTHVEAFTLQP